MQRYKINLSKSRFARFLDLQDFKILKIQKTQNPGSNFFGKIQYVKELPLRYLKV